MLKSLSNNNSLPWVIIGDFNDLMLQSEKCGGRRHPPSLLHGFNEAVEYCCLFEVPMVGHEFTWEKSRGSLNCVEEKLDRGLASSDWLQLFPSAQIINEEAHASDHSALMLFLLPIESFGVRRFRFENAWIREPDCRNKVEVAWNRLNDGDIVSRQKVCGEELFGWGEELRKQFSIKIADCRSEIKRMKGRTDMVSHERLIDMRGTLDTLLLQQEVYWKQRAKKLWLEGGDLNSKFFHAAATNRRKKNSLERLKNDAGEWCSWSSGLDSLIRSYFTQLFSSESCVMDRVLENVMPKLDTAACANLSSIFTREEVKEAVFSMNPDKSPGPDGFNPGFYQRYWDIVGDQVVHSCLLWLNSGMLPDNIHDTNIVLIPKKSKPETVGDMRPIALCNVIYKIVSKMIANRMKHVLDFIISPSQSAFIPGRLISDNVMLAFEVNHYLHQKSRRLVNGIAALKLDMSKAYDRVEWEFIREMMLRLGFPAPWVQLVMQCVTKVKYNVVSGKHVVGPILPGRGLRQGDPLSPYLFIICAEGLSLYLSRLEWEGRIRGCVVADQAPAISHLFFADDSYFFFGANREEAMAIKECLSDYERASGQKINLSKSSISFSRHCPILACQETSEILGVTTVALPDRYLGLPSVVGRSRTQVFGYVEDAVKTRLNSWKARFLSRAGKEIMLKSVIQSLPTYVMSLFQFPKSLCEDLEKLMNAFWWGSDGTGKGSLHWKSWDKLCVPKKYGGMGFRKLFQFNVALLAKQGWRILSNPSSLVARVFKACYFPDCSFLDATLKEGPSFIWRSLMGAQDLLKAGVRKQVGSGSSVNVWEDPWLPDDIFPFVASERLDGVSFESVADLMVEGRREFDIDLLSGHFVPRDVELMLRVPLSLRVDEDVWFWKDERRGLYTVKSGYRRLMESFALNFREESPIWGSVWNLKVPPKVKNLLWRIFSRCFPSKVALKNRRVPISEVCELCHGDTEDDFHVFLRCPMARSVWSLSQIGDVGSQFLSMREFWSWISTKSTDIVCYVAMICWSIWCYRNDVVWNNKHSTASVILQFAMNFFTAWKEAQVCFGVGGGNLGVSSSVWTKPPVGKLKLNVDGGLFSAEFMASAGMVVRDAAGLFIAGKNVPILFNSDPSTVEAFSIREALSWIKNQNWTDIILETDSMVFCQSLARPLKVTSPYNAIVEDCRLILNELTNCSISFVKRSANSVAHLLARSFILPHCQGVWFSNPPDFIVSALLSDSS
ncbi:RNA-directed DNA polymerase (reverse transcriptase)-related family protein [Euphorbia peplus]|nr:RNA-directed DNA polymerase (reverse transcriptase)-related family protein [Euphorbia peplus]